jgi:uncharacterized repeat protein (TIGR01451 family)
VSLGRKLLAATGVGVLSVLSLTVSPASAATPAAGGYADARGIIVDLTVLTAVPVPGALGNTPLDPNTFSVASQSCPPDATKPAEGAFPGNVDASPAVTANTLNTIAGANCSGPSAVASAETEGVTALVNAGAPTITADVIRAQANSDCTKAPNATGSLFTNLTIAGQAIPANPDPNTRIDIPGVATVIVNEQHPTADGRGIVVNGLHVIGASPLLRGDLIISHAVSGVVCTNGAGSDFSGVPGAKPEITFTKDANPSTATAGQTVTYTATAFNKSTDDCDVVSFIDHLDPVFDYTSTSGGFGTAATPTTRADKGVDVVIHPSGVTLGAGKSITQTFVVKLKDGVDPGTYYNNLEIYCAVNGNFASGPLAPVTVPAPAPPVIAPAPAPAPAPQQLPRTGASPLVAASALLLLGAGLGVRRALR